MRGLLVISVVLMIGVVALGESTGLFDDHPGAKANRVATAVSSRAETDGSAGAPGAHEIEIEAGPRGHFRVDATVNGETLTFLVDTGASIVVLGLEDAEMLGFDESMLEFDSRVQTANGVVAVARITLDEIAVGELSLSDVEAVVIRGPAGMPLLGMSFLRRIETYEVRDGRLTLRW